MLWGIQGFKWFFSIFPSDGLVVLFVEQVVVHSPSQFVLFLRPSNCEYSAVYALQHAAPPPLPTQLSTHTQAPGNANRDPHRFPSSCLHESESR